MAETVFSNLRVRGTLAVVGLSTLAAVSATSLTTPRTETSVNNYYGTGSYLSYDDVPCTNTGGLAKYTACSWQNPSSTNTGTLLNVAIDSEAAPTGASITCSTSKDGTSTGSVIIKYLATASGRSLLSRPASGPATLNGSGSIAIQVPPSWYIRCWHSATPGPGLQQWLRVWYYGFFTP